MVELVLVKLTKGAFVTQSCPDFAFREPFPYKVVFEGKYFEKGGREWAQNELPALIYQAFSTAHCPMWPNTNPRQDGITTSRACLPAMLPTTVPSSEHGRVWIKR